MASADSRSNVMLRNLSLAVLKAGRTAVAGYNEAESQSDAATAERVRDWGFRTTVFCPIDYKMLSVA